MKEHSNAGILKAYADNTDLVIFILYPNSKWIRTNPKALMDYPDDEFFACLPQHNENGQCLHWLNGANVQGKFEDEWSDIKPHNGNPDWNGLDQIFMNEEFELRVKPRKEKRWIIYNLDKDHVEQVFNRDASGFSDPSFNHSMHVIEVEV